MQLRSRWHYNLNSLETHFLIFQLFLYGKLLITYVLIETFDEHPLIDCLWNGIGSFSSRGSLPKVFCKRCVLRNLTKFTGKHLRQSLFFNKVAGLRPATLLKKRFWHRCFPVNFVKFLRTTFFRRTPLVASSVVQ